MEMVTLIGLMAATLTTVSFVPQVVRAWRSQSTKDVSLAMFTILCTGVAMWLLYGIIIGDLPIIVANSVTLVLAGSIIVAKLRFG